MVAGNIDIHNRPVVKNRDGTISTVRTISIGTPQGEVLIPTVVGGKVVSEEQAIREYERTGQHLGIFRTPAEATAYAESLHQQQEREYVRPRSSGFRGVEGETITSTFRSPAHNRSVGGVANSYHTRRYPDGRPMARDSVPPPGMSMSVYATMLRRMNPGLEVINEGDHVHLEPRGRR